MGKKIIYFVRHGEYNRVSGSLNDIGISQLEKAAEIIKQDLGNGESGSGIEKIAIYSSPIKRAVESAKIIQEALGLEKIVAKAELACESYLVGEMVNEICNDSVDVAILVSHQPDLEAYLGCPIAKGQVVKKIYES
jgi:broad specificity phosphatase PhoE